MLQDMRRILSIPPKARTEDDLAILGSLTRNIRFFCNLSDEVHRQRRRKVNSPGSFCRVRLGR